MAYELFEHGMEVGLSNSKVTEPDNSDLGFTFVVSSPINLATNPKVNEFVRIGSIEEAKAYLGYSDDMSYSSNRVISAFLENPKQPVGPVYCLNVLDPEKHAGKEGTESVSFYKGVGYVTNPNAVLSSIDLEDRTAGKDYVMKADGKGIQISLLLDTTEPGYNSENKQLVVLRQDEAEGTKWRTLYKNAGISMDSKTGLLTFSPDDSFTHDPLLEQDGAIVANLCFGRASTADRVSFSYDDGSGKQTLEIDLNNPGENAAHVDESRNVLFALPVAKLEGKDGKPERVKTYAVKFELNWNIPDHGTVYEAFTVKFPPRTELENRTGLLNASYQTVDPSKVTKEDVIGYKDATGDATGLQAIELMEEQTGTIPTDLAIPGWANDPDVYKAMQEINPVAGHWFVYTYGDIDVDQVKTIEQAIEYVADKELRYETGALFWPLEKDTDGITREMSIGYMAAQLRKDIENDGIPCESASNVETHLAGKDFGDHPSIKGFPQLAANDLNAKGINTVCYHDGGQKYWGTYTSAYDVENNDLDPRSMYFPVMRMLMFLCNGFQKRYAYLIDRPMSRAIKDDILIKERQYLDSLVSRGALLGHPSIEFIESKNPMSNIIKGRFVYDIDSTPAIPLQHIKASIHYTDEGLYTAFGPVEEE